MAERWEHPTVPAVHGRETAGAASPASPFDPAGERFVERAELGRGGMGRVYEASDTQLDRPVAIKQSLADDAEMQARFEREVRITARLQHPGIVPVLDAGRDASGRPFYVMRKIDGRPLADIVAERATADRIGLVPDLVAAVDAVAYAHARGVIHRDIKPGNILIGPFGETLVIDWGLARELDDADATPSPQVGVADRDLTRLGSAMGTPGFMAPEQARGEPCDRRGDVFALGATLYFVVVGAPAYGDDPTAAIDRAAAGAPPDLERIPDRVPAELVAVIAKAMAVDAADRYADAGALAGDLRRFLAGQLVAAHRYTARELIARWIRRHRVAVAIATAALAAIATIAVVAIRRVLAERDRADAARVAATSRADDLLVERADSIAITDPTRAAVLIAQLAPASTAWPRATAVLQTARGHGVASGRLAHPGSTTTMSPSRVVGSADGAHVFTFGGHDRTIVRHDVRLREPPVVIARFDRTLTDLVAIDRDSLIAIDQQYDAFAVDHDGVVQRLGSGGPVHYPFAPGDGRVFALRHPKGSLYQLGASGEPPVDLGLGDVTAAAWIGDGIVAAAGDRIVHRSDAGVVIELERDDRASTASFATSPGKQRFASCLSGRIVEWERRAGGPVERGRWAVDAPGCAYAGDALIAGDVPDLFALVPGKPAAVFGEVAFGVHATTDRELFAAPFTGGLLRITATNAIRFGPSERFFSLGVAGDHLLAITFHGRMLSWDLAPLRPLALAIHTGPDHLLVDDAVWWVDGHSSYRIALAPGAVATDFVERRPICSGATHEILAADRPGEHQLEHLDLRTLARTTLGEAVVSVTCSRAGDRIATLSPDRRTARVVDTAAPDRTIARLSLAFEPQRAAIEGRWLVAGDDSGTVERIDLVTGARRRLQLAATPDGIAIDRDGDVAILAGTNLSRWDGAVQSPPVTVPATAFGIAWNPVGIVGVTGEKTLFVVDERGRVTTYYGGIGFVPQVADEAPFATISRPDGGADVIDLVTGARWQLPGPAKFAAIDRRAARVAISRPPPARPVIEIYDRLDDGAIRAWLDGATNGRVDPGSTRVVFP